MNVFHVNRIIKSIPSPEVHFLKSQNHFTTNIYAYILSKANYAFHDCTLRAVIPC